MRSSARLLLSPVLAWLVLVLPSLPARGVVRDGGVDPANLGQGGWLYLMNDATNHLSPNSIAAVTNENSLFQYMRSQGLRYVIVKSGTGDTNYWDGTYSGSTPVFTSNLVNIAHANGLKIFGSNRSYGQDIAGEIQVAGYVFSNNADGLIFDAESEWEYDAVKHPWITNGPAQAWWLCGTVRSNWPTKFIAHNPYDTLYLHSTFPFKEFGYWTDCVMPQVYHHSASQGNAFAAIHWTDVNYKKFQDSLLSMAPSNINGQTIYWTNSIKPLVMMRDVYGANYTSSPYPPQDVMNFLDYLVADPNCVTAGGYQGSDYFRSELYDTNQWAYIKAATIGTFPGIINNIIMDDARALISGSWTNVKTIDATTSTVLFYGATGTDTNSFGTNYFAKGKGAGSAFVQFSPNIVTAGAYNVYQWHPTLTNASASVPHIITYNGGVVTNYANQQTNGGNWSFLGRFNFAAGTAGNVRVTDAIPEANGVAMADGLKLVFVPPLPTPPARVKATAVSFSEIDLTWTDTAIETTGFVVARGTNSGGPYTDIASLPAYPTSFNDTGLAGDTAYDYVVRTTNPSGTSPNSAQASAITFPAAGLGDDSWGQCDVSLWLKNVTNVVAIAAGAWHSLALHADGTVVAWGDGFNGQCDVPTDLTNALAIAAGGYHSLAIRADGTVVAWGNNDYGQCRVPQTLSHVMAISAGAWHSLALRTDGSVVAWGDNSWGQTDVPVGLSNVVAIAAGGNHNLALRTNSTLVAWGENTDDGGAFVGQSVVPSGLTNVAGVAAGEYHSLAWRADGTVAAWGDNSEGQCSVPAGLNGVVALAGGGAHTLALEADGSVLAWGANWDGQCSLPSALRNVVGLATGEYHSLVLVAGPIPVPLLRSPAWENNRFSVLLQTLNRKSYTLEYRSSFQTNWVALSTNAGNGALKQLCHTPTPPTPSQGFYRVHLW